MSSSSQAPESWISAFCSLIGHEYFAEVSEDFIEDDFNLTGLQSQVPMYKEALEMILDVEPEDASEEEEEEDDDDDDDDDEMHDGPAGMGRAYRRGADAAERRHLRMASDLSVIESSAEMLYGLIHQRFITSRQGIQQMAEKYELGHFGQCPRVNCYGAKVLPVGCSDIPGQETVKLFCPSCLDVYSPPNSRFQTVDGAFFGTTFGCLFFMTFPELDVAGQRPPSQSDPSPSTSSPLGSNQNNGQPPSSARGSTFASPTAFSPTQQQHAGTTQLPPQPETMNGIATKNLAPGLGPGNIYEPRIYGFRVSEVAKTGPRMKWLRSRPVDVTELDECRIWARSRAAEASTAQLGDSEMIDENEEMDDGEMEDDDMDTTSLPPTQQHASEQENYDMENASSQQREALSSQRKKQSRRRTHDSLLNGSASASTAAAAATAGANSVSVGDGG